MTTEEGTAADWTGVARSMAPEEIAAAAVSGALPLDVDRTVGLGQHLLQLQEFDAAERFLAVARASGDAGVRGAAENGVAARELMRGERRRAGAALKRAEATGHPDVVEEARLTRALAATDPDEMVVLFRVCSRSPRERVAQEAALELGFMLLHGGGSREEALELLSVAHRSGQPYVEARAAVELADDLMEQAPRGQLPPAEHERVLTWLRQAEDSPYPAVLAKAELLHGLVHWERHEPEPARELWLRSARRHMPYSSYRSAINLVIDCLQDDGAGPLVAAQHLEHALLAEPAAAPDRLVTTALDSARPFQVVVALALTQAEKSPDRVLRRAAKRALKRF
jgi:hypothetical protein